MSVGRLLASLIALSWAVAACGGGDQAANNGMLALRGSVYSDHRVDQPCETQAGHELRPDPLAGIRLTFTSDQGASLATAVTGPLRWEDLEYGCRFFAEYAAELPESADYRVAFEPQPPASSVGYFSGAEDLEPQQITHEQLTANGGVWSFEAMPSYVVP